MVFRSFKSLTGSVLQDLVLCLSSQLSCKCFHTCVFASCLHVAIPNIGFLSLSFIYVIYYIVSISSTPYVTIDRRRKHCGWEQPDCFSISGFTIETDRLI